MSQVAQWVLFFVIAVGGSEASGEVANSNSAIANCLQDPNCHKRLVISHRLRNTQAPEHSRAAIKEGLVRGVKAFDADIVSSKDGKAFVMHGNKLDGQTTLSGKIIERHSSELQKAFLANGEALPSLEDLYELTRGKAILKMDFKHDIVESVADWVCKNGSFDDFIFYVDGVEKETMEKVESAARAKARYPQMIVMVKLIAEKDVAVVRGLFGGLPDIVRVVPDARHSSPAAVNFFLQLSTKKFVYVQPWEKPWCSGEQRQPIPPEFSQVFSKVDVIETDFPDCWKR